MTSSLPGYSSHFGIENIPFGIGSSTSHSEPQGVTRLEDNVIFLADLNDILQDIPDLPSSTFTQSTLNAFAALPKSVHEDVRSKLQAALKDSSSLPKNAVEPIASVTMHLPVDCGDFSDFSCSFDHVQNASEAMTGTRSHPPAFFYQPIGYAGRCSSLDVSGTPQNRPIGTYWTVGAIVGKPLPRKERLLARDAGEHIFGFVLVNDWSSRDIQALEMNPLGPLNGKNLGTNVSPWVVTSDALKAFRKPSIARRESVKIPKHLSDSGNEALDITLQVHLSSETDRKSSSIACKSNSAYMYWTLEQCLSQQALAGCGLRTGDIVATGTVSGSGEDQHGCLMEFMKQGATPPRGYLEDGEVVTLDGYCGEGVGFGECVGTLLPAKPFDHLL
ncbi:hypothetical protein B0A48_12580 [Cryoendolithus antarcticus]|uniref:Fumarylacetoacetase n=1 Tax=Cryoendolithus antarcticus TaxID=1507870 RepID=A0A1V8SQT8_9PEZI|nr:hypothetical protein B0A48_12580 [Cryoendolithus antarcticus]